MRQLRRKRECFFGVFSLSYFQELVNIVAVEAVKIDISQGECTDSLNTHDIDSYKNEGTKSRNFAYGFTHLCEEIHGFQFKNPWYSTRRLREESYKYLMGENKVEKLTNVNME